MCGILGVWDRREIAGELIYGLNALQHRGQDAAGVVTFDGVFHVKKGQGLVSQVFQDKHVDRLRGPYGLGHVRYATMGSNDAADLQPLCLNYPYGLAMVHNGNVVNFHEVRDRLAEEHHRLVDTSNDVALILYTLAAQLEQRDLRALSIDDLFACVEATQKQVLGAYSAIAVIANRGLLAFSDPYGIRPIVLGHRDTDHGRAYAVASETTCLDQMGYEYEDDLAPGEMLFIDTEGQVHRRIGQQGRQAFCVFEFIYFAREDSAIHNRLVAHERVRMGKALGHRVREAGIDPEVIIDVPSSGYFFASALAEELGVPYRRGLAKNPHAGRTFITLSQEARERMARQKLNPIRDVVRGKRIAIVDDSIVRGTTARHLVERLRRSGAKEVHFVSAAPPVKYPCIYGIDMSTREELIAVTHTLEQTRDLIGADSLIYQDVDALVDLYQELPSCFACFNGVYPTGDHPELLQQIAREKAASGRL